MDMELLLWSIEGDRAIESDHIQRVAHARAAPQPDRSMSGAARRIARLLVRRRAARDEAPATRVEGGANVRRSY